jgi:hypothetical protein
MKIAPILTLTATITSRVQTGAVDVFGDPTWTTTTTSGVRCELQARQRTESTDGLSEMTDTTFECWLEPGTIIDADDQIAISGTTYDVIGTPWVARNPRTGNTEFVHCWLRKTI